MIIRLNGSEFKMVREMIDVVDPASGKVLDSFPNMIESDVDLAVKAAGETFTNWASLSQYDRSAILERFIELSNNCKQELTNLLSSETGKPLAEANGEINACSVITKAYCERANHMYGNCLPRGSKQTGGLNDIVFTRREPIGVFACIIPFNFPVAMFAHKVIPALVVGNTVVIKPSSDCPLTVNYLTKLLYDAGVPEKAVQLVVGRGSGAAGDYLSGHPGIQAISMTGSQKVGIRIYQNASANLTRVFLELGANDAFIVLEDADLDLAIAEAMESRLLYAGQVCCGSKRFIVHRDCVKEFVQRLINALSKIRVGNPKASDTMMGCLISEKAAQEVEQMVSYTISQGAECVFGGHRNSAFFEPTILTKVTADMDVARDMEIFGPVFPIIEIDNDEEAVRIANQSQFGLSGAVFSRNSQRAMLVADALHTATIVINGGTDYRTPELAFGGYKKSGFGREGVSRTLDEMTQEKNFVLKNILRKPVT